MCFPIVYSRCQVRTYIISYLHKLFVNLSRRLVILSGEHWRLSLFLNWRLALDYFPCWWEVHKFLFAIKRNLTTIFFHSKGVYFFRMKSMQLSIIFRLKQLLMYILWNGFFSRKRIIFFQMYTLYMFQFISLEAC